MSDYYYSDPFTDAIEEFGYILDEIPEELLFFGIFALIGAVILFIAIYSTVLYFLQAVPLFRIGKKLGYNKNFLPWIPFYQNLIALFVLSDLPGRKDFHITPKIDSSLKINTRIKSYITLGVSYGVYYILTFVNNIVSAIFSSIPVISVLVSVFSSVFSFTLSISVTLLMTVATYVYLRDLIDIFKPDREQNKKTALIIAIINNFTVGLALPIYLLVLSKNDPLPEEPEYLYDENIPSDYESEADEAPCFYEGNNAESVRVQTDCTVDTWEAESTDIQ